MADDLVAAAYSLTVDDAAVGVAAMAVGFFLTFFGRRLLKCLIVLVGFLAGGLFALANGPWIFALLCQHLGYPADYYLASVYGLGLLLGLLGAALAFYAWRLGVYAAGALGGMTLGSWVTVSCQEAVERVMPRNAFILLFAILGAVVAIFLEDYVLMTASVVAGSTLLMYGVDKFAQVGFARTLGHLVDLDRYRAGEMTPSGYYMLVGTVCIAMVGLVFQCLWRRDRHGKQPK